MNNPWTPTQSCIPTMRLVPSEEGEIEPYYESAQVIVVYGDTLAFARLVIDPKEFSFIWVLDAFYPDDLSVSSGEGIPFEQVSYWMPTPVPPVNSTPRPVLKPAPRFSQEVEEKLDMSLREFMGRYLNEQNGMDARWHTALREGHLQGNEGEDLTVREAFVENKIASPDWKGKMSVVNKLFWTKDIGRKSVQRLLDVLKEHGIPYP